MKNEAQSGPQPLEEGYRPKRDIAKKGYQPTGDASAEGADPNPPDLDSNVQPPNSGQASDSSSETK